MCECESKLRSPLGMPCELQFIRGQFRLFGLSLDVVMLLLKAQ
ncbi:Uncharacterised protein [Vibrio cholerae]|nr:Uncharacterised protein [Vibrio cholerae]